MSDPTQTQESTESSQRAAYEQGQRAVRQAFEAPLEQTVQLQKNAAQLFLSGLQIGSEAQRRGVELTREAMDNYFSNAEAAVQSTEQLTETGVEAMRAGQGAIEQGMQSAQASAPRFQSQQGGTTSPQQGGFQTQGGRGQGGQQPMQSQQTPAQQFPDPGQQPQGASQQSRTPHQYPETTQGYSTAPAQQANPQGYAQFGERGQSAGAPPRETGYEEQGREEGAEPPAPSR